MNCNLRGKVVVFEEVLTGSPAPLERWGVVVGGFGADPRLVGTRLQVLPLGGVPAAVQQVDAVYLDVDATRAVWHLFGEETAATWAQMLAAAIQLFHKGGENFASDHRAQEVYRGSGRG